MGSAEVEGFPTYLAVERRVSASTQNQALGAILFLYRHVLEMTLPWLENVVRARKSTHVPVVLPRREVQALLAELEPPFNLIALLLYGSGFRLMEALRLRVKDIDFEYSQIVVRDGKGKKDRVTILADTAASALRAHLGLMKARHELASKRGYGGVELPESLARKYPTAQNDWSWQYVFPAARPSRDPRSGAIRRHHLHETSVQRAVRIAARRVAILKPVGPHAAALLRNAPAGARLRHSNGAGTHGPRGRTHDADLHARHEEGRGRREEPARLRATPRSPTSRDCAAGRRPCLSRPRRDRRVIATAQCRRSAQSRDRRAAWR